MKDVLKDRIFILQDHLWSGGAARAASRWAHQLEKKGAKVTQVAGDELPNNGFLLTGKPPRGLERLQEWITGRRTRKIRLEAKFFSLLEQMHPRAIWFHNIAGGVKWGWSEKMVSVARHFAPVLWTLHDMWALGDSSQSYWQEDQMMEGGRGKGAGAGGLKGIGAEGLRRSRVEKVCQEPGKYPIRVTAPSQWLANLTKELTSQECGFLPNPIDLEIFSPGDQKAARQRFGLPEDKIIVLAGADSLQDRRKGLDLLRGAWSLTDTRGATLTLFGRHGENRPGEVYLGNLNSDEELVAAYRAADLYVHPARMENAPCTIQESLACGTPVLAFAVGGISEMVEPRKTGFLAAKVDAKSLGEELAAAMADRNRLGRMRDACRGAAKVIWGPQRSVERLDQVFSELAPVTGR